MSSTPVLPATDPAAYPFWATERVRYDDLDAIGHVNNKSTLTYFESGRVDFLLKTGLWVQGESRQNVVARIEVDYLHELHFPADLRIGLRILRIGNKSYTIGSAIFHNDVCINTTEVVMVRLDQTTRQALVLNDHERAILQRYL